MWHRQEVSDTRPGGRTEQEQKKVPEQSREAMPLPTQLGGQVKRFVKGDPHSNHSKESVRIVCK